MIVGTVADLQGRVEIVFRLSDQPERTVEYVLDTGFQGELALPPATIAALGLSAGGHMWANLADDSDVPVPVFGAVIVWDERETGVTVMAMGRPEPNLTALEMRLVTTCSMRVRSQLPQTRSVVREVSQPYTA